MDNPLTKGTRASEQRSIQPARECIVVAVIYSANPFFLGLNSKIFIPGEFSVEVNAHLLEALLVGNEAGLLEDLL